MRGRGVVRVAAGLLLLLAGAAWAAGPRYVAGAQWTNNGSPMGWYAAKVQYMVDAGPMSSSVDHAAGVALVDAAAAVWNVPGVGVALSDGGVLAEDVSGDNVYLGQSGLIWPADVQSANYAAVQIAVVFDADGAITETLLGGGASDVTNCRQNGVTESVDLFVQPGKIAHALVIVNGRCVGAAQESQLQIRYQMQRVFGRVLGVGWSQLNDNVFTGATTPTYGQQMHWPVMHPMEILCGPYTYQCMPQPFALRPDDVAGLRLVYATNMTASIPGTIVAVGTLYYPGKFPMSGVNVVASRAVDGYASVSSVSGFLTVGDVGNPVSGPSADTAGVGGGTSVLLKGYVVFEGVPAPATGTTNLVVTTEAVNPLYVGQYAVGPYRAGSPSLSGSAVATGYGTMYSGYSAYLGGWLVADAASECNGTADGTESAPVLAPAEGVWSGRLCGVGHSAWSSAAVRAGRTATLEVTATDDSGNASVTKAMPLLGMWHGSDATGTLPTMAKVTVAFNAMRVGMTQMRVSFAATERVRFAVADQRGDGRPDYTYRARLLYADEVLPARMGAAGGAVRILGSGFAAGNTVTIGGVAAKVVRVSATEIDAVAPTLAAMGGASQADVTVADLTTGGTTTITAGLLYAGASTDVVSVVTSPASQVEVGAAVPFAVRVLDGAGNPAANTPVVVSVAGGNGVVGACALASCTLVTDGSGLAQTTVAAQAAGAVTVVATLGNGASAKAAFTAVAAARVLSFARPVEYLAAGAGAVFHPAVVLSAGGVAVAWTSGSARVVLGSSAGMSGVDGSASVSAVESLRDGESASVQACGWGGGVCATQALTGVAAANLRVVVVSGDGQSVGSASSLGNVVMRVVDVAGHAVAGAAVSVLQEVTGWQPACVAGGRCAAAPVYGKGSLGVMSDDDGLFTVAPMQYANTASVTKVTAVVGTLGEVTVVLQKTP